MVTVTVRVMNFWYFEEQNRHGQWFARCTAGGKPDARFNRPGWMNIRNVQEITQDDFLLELKELAVKYGHGDVLSPPPEPDITVRLRSPSSCSFEIRMLLKEAANEIERLRK